MNLLQDFKTKNVNGLQVSEELFCSCRFKKSESKSVQLPTTSPTQQEAEKAIGAFVTPRIGTGATPYTEQLTAGVPDLVSQAYSNFEGADRSLSDAEQASLSGLATGESFYESDPEQVIQDWRENFANPLTAYYNEFVRPEVRKMRQYAEVNVPQKDTTTRASMEALYVKVAAVAPSVCSDITAAVCP
jgi:hypothetical protein